MIGVYDLEHYRVALAHHRGEVDGGPYDVDLTAGLDACHCKGFQFGQRCQHVEAAKAMRAKLLETLQTIPKESCAIP